MSNAFVKWRWDVLLCWYFPLLGECLLSVTLFFFKRLASLLADKRDISYNVVMSWLCCRVSFSLLHSAIDCLRGAQLSKGHAAVSLEAFDLALSEGRMSLNH